MKAIGFEAAGDLWMAIGEGPTSKRVKAPAPVLSTEQKHGGEKSMKLVLNSADGLPAVPDGGVDASAADAGAPAQVRNEWFFAIADKTGIYPFLQAGRTIKFWVWVPADNKVGALQIVVHTGSGWKNGVAAGFTAGAWNEATFTLPADFDCSKADPQGLFEIGIFLATGPGEVWNQAIYIDDLTISAKAP